MLTAGNVSDVKAAPALLEGAGSMRYLLGDKGYDADHLRRAARNGAIPVTQAVATASGPSAMTSSATKVATSSRTTSAASRNSAVSPPAKISSQATSCLR
jgi:IS5 family transposase